MYTNKIKHTNALFMCYINMHKDVYVQNLFLFSFSNLINLNNLLLIEYHYHAFNKFLSSKVTVKTIVRIKIVRKKKL